MRNLKIHKRAGFTLLEMMIIIVIIGVLTTMAAPSFFTWIPKMKLKSEAKQNLSYLRQARSKAVAENCQYGVYFNLLSDEICYFKDTSNPALLTYAEGVDSLLVAPVVMGSSVSYSDCSLFNNTVIFFPNGSASTSGSISVKDDESGDTFVISVLASTGRVKLQQ